MKNLFSAAGAWRCIVSIIVLLFFAACEEFPFPKDPDGTLDGVMASGRMTVVAVDHEPWVIWNDRDVPTGAEVEIIEVFARSLGVSVEWKKAPAFDALEATGRGDVDLAIGGFSKKAVSAHKGVAATYVYFTEALVIAVDPSGRIPTELDGQQVYSPPEQMVASLVEDENGVPVNEKTEATRFVVLPDWQAAQQGFASTGISLRRYKHVFAVPQGENAWIMRLERFLRKEVRNFAAKLRKNQS